MPFPTFASMQNIYTADQPTYEAIVADLSTQMADPAAVLRGRRESETFGEHFVFHVKGNLTQEQLTTLGEAMVTEGATAAILAVRPVTGPMPSNDVIDIIAAMGEGYPTMQWMQVYVGRK